MGENKEGKKAVPKTATEEKGPIDIKAMSEQIAKMLQEGKEGWRLPIFYNTLDGSPFGPNLDAGYTRIGDTSIRTPKLNAASMKVMQNEEESKARHETWRQHDRERAERVAKGKAILSKAVAQINAGIKAEDAKRHPLKAEHWNAKAGKGKWDPQNVAEVKDAQGNVTTKGSKAGDEYAAFKKEFEAWTKGLVVDKKTGKNSEGRMRYGDSSGTLKKYQDLGIVTYDKDGNQIVNWDKVTSQEQVDVLKGEMAKDNEFQGRMIAEQKQREKDIVQGARDYAKQNGVDLPKDATDAQVIRTVFAHKSQAAADAVRNGDAGAAGRMYGSANLYDAVNIMHESIGIAKDEAMANGLEGDDATVMASTEAGKIGNSAMTSMMMAVQKVATDAKDMSVNKDGDVADALAEQQSAILAMNESLRGNESKGVEGSNAEATRKLAEQKAKVEAAKKQKPKEGVA